MIGINNSTEIISYIEKESLVQSVIDQLNKDFQLSNVNYTIENLIDLKELVVQLEKIILSLLEKNYDGYLNLIYRVDVSAKELALLQKLTFNERISGVVFLILKRELQKVWFRLNY